MLIKFTTTLERFGEKGEKSAWTFIRIPDACLQSWNITARSPFQVKGKIDDCVISQKAVMSMGEGQMILPINAALRKKTRKEAGDKVEMALAVDKSEYKIHKELLLCLEDEPAAKKNFNAMTKSHQKYYSKWIEEAKTKPTAAKRIATAVTTLALGLNYSEMIHWQRENKVDF